jgi:hypothetical protein
LKYVRVVQCLAKGDAIHLEMLGENEETHSFEVGAECAGLLASSLAAEFEKLNAQDKEQQLVRPTGMQTAVTEKGEPMILMSLQGGVELPLVFKPESLAAIVAELQGLLSATQSGSEVRWH